MKIELQGAVCVLTGRMQKISKARAIHQLEAAGARVTTSVSAKTTFVVVAEKWTNAHTNAKAMGLPILTESQLIALLNGEPLEVEQPGESGDRSVDDLLGEVRGVMEGAPDSEMWHAIIKLLDDCQDTQVHILTEYIDGYIARWTQERMQGQRATTLDLTQLDEEDYTRRWLWRSYESIIGELRVAPEHWVGELQQGVRSSKFAVVRALDLRDAGLSSKAIIQLLDHPDLTHLKVLKLSSYLKMSGALIKRICEDTRLQDLGPAEVGAKGNKAFIAHGQPTSSIHTLDLRCYSHQYYGDTCELLSSSSFHNVHTLILRPSDTYIKAVLAYLDDTDALKQTYRLRFTPHGGVDHIWQHILKSRWVVKQIRELDLGEVRYHAQHDKSSWKKFWDLDYKGHLDCLDLRALRDREDEQDRSKVNKMLTQYLPDSKLLRHVDTLALGQWKTPELAETLAQAFPHLTVQ